MSKKLSVIIVLIGAALGGAIGVFLREMSKAGLTSVQVLTIRSLFSVVVMAAALSVKHRSLLKIGLKDWPLFVGTGIISLTFHNLCYYEAIKASSMSVAAVLLYTSPIFVTIMAALIFKERMTAKSLLALALTFGGCVLVSGIMSQGGGIGAYAFLLGINAGFGYALYSIFARFALRKYHMITVIFYTFLFSSASCIALCIAEGGVSSFTALLSPSLLPVNFLFAFICCVLPYTCYTLGLKNIQASHASILGTFEPVVATLLGVLIYNERPELIKLAGMALIFIAVVLIANSRPYSPATPPSTPASQ